MANIDLLEVHARELSGMTDEWCVYEYQVLNHDCKGGNAVFKLTGAIAPIKSKGPLKGERNWLKLKRETKREIYIPKSDHEAWLNEWSIKTGKCQTCAGEKELLKSFSVESGPVMKPCHVCNGTGKRTHD